MFRVQVQLVKGGAWTSLPDQASSHDAWVAVHEMHVDYYMAQVIYPEA